MLTSPSQRSWRRKIGCAFRRERCPASSSIAHQIPRRPGLLTLWPTLNRSHHDRILGGGLEVHELKRRETGNSPRAVTMDVAFGISLAAAGGQYGTIKIRSGRGRQRTLLVLILSAFGGPPSVGVSPKTPMTCCSPEFHSSERCAAEALRNHAGCKNHASSSCILQVVRAREQFKCPRNGLHTQHLHSQRTLWCGTC